MNRIAETLIKLGDMIACVFETSIRIAIHYCEENQTHEYTSYDDYLDYLQKVLEKVVNWKD